MYWFDMLIYCKMITITTLANICITSHNYHFFLVVRCTILAMFKFSSVQFSRSVMSDSLWPHESQHARPPCPSPTPGVHPDSRPSSQWCHPTISSSVIPFSSCLQSFPASGSFPMSQLFTIRWPKYWSFNFSISPFNKYSGLISSRMEWLDLLAIQGTLNSLLQHHSAKASILRCSAFFMHQLLYPYVTSGKAIALTIWIFVSKVMSLLFNMLSRFVIGEGNGNTPVFLPGESQGRGSLVGCRPWGRTESDTAEAT